MARVRRTSSDSPRAGPEPAAVIPLTEIEAPTREGLEAMGAEELAVWRELRGVFFRAEVGTEFDPRQLFRGGMTERQRDAWRRRRRKWLARLFKDDPRVDDGA